MCVYLCVPLRTPFMLLRQSSRFFKAAETHNRRSGTWLECVYVCACVGVCVHACVYACVRLFTVSVCVFVRGHLLVFKEALHEVGDRT